MLEHQVLKLHPDNLADFDFLLTRLNLKEAQGPGQRMVSSVLKEGYSTTDLRQFIPEFRRRLERLNRVHNKHQGQGDPLKAIARLHRLSRRDCKLSLARYLFTPEEVVTEIRSHLQVSDGAKDLDTSQPPFVTDEIERSIAACRNSRPEFSADFVRRPGFIGCLRPRALKSTRWSNIQQPLLCWLSSLPAATSNSKSKGPAGKASIG